MSTHNMYFCEKKNKKLIDLIPTMTLFGYMNLYYVLANSFANILYRTSLIIAPDELSI